MSGSKKNNGFTLVEVLVAIVILGLTVGIFGYLVNAYKFNRISQRESEMLNFARSYVDATRGVWSDEKLFTYAVLPNLSLPPRYKLTVTVVDNDLNPAPPSGASATKLTQSANCTATTAAKQTTVAATAGCAMKGFYTQTGVGPAAVTVALLNKDAITRLLTVEMEDQLGSGNSTKVKLSALVLIPI